MTSYQITAGRQFAKRTSATPAPPGHAWDCRGHAWDCRGHAWD